MALQKRKGRDMILLKRLVLFITCLSFFGLLSCTNSGTNSNSSSSGTSGTGTDWKITIQVGTNPLPFNGSVNGATVTFGTNTTTVMAIVKDGTGAPAPNGTNVCMAAVLNGFIIPNDGTVYKNVCELVSNNLGQSIQTYAGKLSAGDDTIEVASQGVIAHTIIHNN